MEYWLFAGFLLLAAAQDLRKKEVDIWIFLLFGGMALVVLLKKAAANPEQWVLSEPAGGALLGVIIVVVSVFSRGKIGAGDGCFFIVSGLMLGFWENLLLIFYGMLLCGLFSLVYLVWCRLWLEKSVGAYTIPFLPFVALPGVWLVLQRVK